MERKRAPLPPSPSLLLTVGSHFGLSHASFNWPIFKPNLDGASPDFGTACGKIPRRSRLCQTSSIYRTLRNYSLPKDGRIRSKSIDSEKNYSSHTKIPSMRYRPFQYSIDWLRNFDLCDLPDRSCCQCSQCKVTGGWP